MKPLLLILLALPVASQDTATAEAQAQEQTEPLSAVPEGRLAGSVDFGYRWASDVKGDFNTYRSVVNLGQGPKLFGFDWTIRDPSRRLFDRVDIRGNSWGGDPYNTGQIDIQRERTYDFSFDYRNIAYFNFLPSFANPGRDRGLLLNERSFDIVRRTSDLRLTIFPGSRLTPYVGYTRNSGFGTGTTVFVSQGNEFPVANRLRDHTDNYRGGLHLELSRFHLTLEQGGTTFKDDQQLFNTAPNAGNVGTPFLGRQLVLGNLLEAYGVRGDGVYSKALLSAAAVSWANIYGQFLYSRPRADVDYSRNAGGTFFLFNALRFYGAEETLMSSQAKLPHTSGSFNIELRPRTRIRIIESWMTDRLHNTSAGFLAEQFLLSLPAIEPQTVFSNDRLVWNYTQQELNVLFDLNSRLTLRGGHRYVWGNAEARAGRVSPAEGLEEGAVRRHVALVGTRLHAGRQFSFTADFEGSSGNRTYFRTSLHNYQKARLQARYQVTSSFVFSANASVLRNENPSRNIDYDFLSRRNTVSATWMPGGGTRLSVIAEYSRYTLRSNLTYLAPSTLDSEASLYRDNGHIGTSLLSLALPKSGGTEPRIAVGGSFFVSSGSRPARYYQPLAGLSVPLGRHAEWKSEWRWYMLSQESYLLEGFRTHRFVTGFRLTM